MSDGLFMAFVSALMVSLAIFGIIECSERMTKEKIIEEKGFCIEQESTGVQFKKCFELKAAPHE